MSKARILTVNGGSSSIKCAVFEVGDSLIKVRDGSLSRKANPDAATAAKILMKWLDAQPQHEPLTAVGHRIVYGGPRYSHPQRITPALVKELRRLSPYDPEHLPTEIALIEAIRRRFSSLIQIACFDTAFHHDMPRVAQMLPLPRRYATKGLRRYGFHGLSYAYLMRELERIAGAKAANGRIILAHLGSGASLAAVRDRKSVDTSMGFTPAAGLVMGSRSGDLDPGVMSFLARSEKMSAARFDRMINHESGLLGVSATSSDMRHLLAREKRDVRAAEAVALFCYQAKKWIGAYAAALSGLDTLVFSGGIGENSPIVRARICAGLAFLGIRLHKNRNSKSAPLISADESRVQVRVIRTDEARMIARSTMALLGVKTNLKEI